jgi:hypothetical protein
MKPYIFHSSIWNFVLWFKYLTYASHGDHKQTLVPCLISISKAINIKKSIASNSDLWPNCQINQWLPNPNLNHRQINISFKKHELPINDQIKDIIKPTWDIGVSLGNLHVFKKTSQKLFNSPNASNHYRQI